MSKGKIVMERDGMKAVGTDLLAFDEDLYADVPGGGLENITARDVAIPYIRILQAISNAVKNGPAKIPGAEEGDIYNGGTSEVVKGNIGIDVVPCAFKKMWIQRGPRGADNKPGPYVTTLDAEPKTGRKEGNIIHLANGDEVTDVSDHYVVVVDGNVWQKALIRMASTQLKKSRFWNGLMMGIQWEIKGERKTPPSFSHMYHLTTATDPPKDGNTWSGWVIGKPEKITNVQLAIFAKEFYRSVMGGLVKVADEESASDSESTTDDIPF